MPTEEEQKAIARAVQAAPVTHVNIFTGMVLNDSGMYRISGAEQIEPDGPVMARSGWLITPANALKLHELLGKLIDMARQQ